MRIVQPTVNQEYNNILMIVIIIMIIVLLVHYFAGVTQHWKQCWHSGVSLGISEVCVNFHRWAELFEQNFVIKKNFHQDGPTSQA